MMSRATLLALLAATATASSPAVADTPSELPAQAHADLGLSVVGFGYETPVSGHVAVEGQAGIFGTYFLPWFDLGDDVKGLQVGTRVTWFASTSGRGLYVAPYLRAVAVRGELDDVTGEGFGFTAGAFAGWAFALTAKLDLRLGAGAQYISYDADPLAASTPFIALDVLVGYRR
ncbi:MAG TPA: hypothetical protein VM261_14725 [Kofleriaceae bacterium]|nr:hypothetical protein [Kofleriaceae bacterium]